MYLTEFYKLSLSSKKTKNKTKKPKQNPLIEWNCVIMFVLKAGAQVQIAANHTVMLGKFNSLSSFYIRVSFLKIYGFYDYNKFWFLTCEQLTCLCIICSAFVVLEQLSWE